MKYITPTDVLEYLFCPCFTFYINVLEIDQHEHKRILVSKGRDMHTLKMVSNKDYLRKKIGAVGKEVDVYLTSEKLHLVGRVDEVLFLNDGTASPLDYKYCFWNNKVFKTHKTQQVLYSLLIEEIYNIKVTRAYIVYIRSKNKLIELDITDRLKATASKTCDDIFNIIEKCKFPNATKDKIKCTDCTYKNLCFS